MATLISKNNSRHLPAEWAPQQGVMLTWPNREAYWWDHVRSAIDRCFAEIATAISQREQVIISCLDEKHQHEIHRLLSERHANFNNVDFFKFPADDVWARDHGPITIYENKRRLLLDFIFNGWGNKYPAKNDNALTKKLWGKHAFGDCDLKSLNWVLEGGSIDTNGEGVLLTTESCLLSRNPEFSKHQLEEKLKQDLGVHTVHWLSHGHLAGDDTDGHIDTLARFVNKNTICYVACHDEADEHYAELKAMETELEHLCDRDDHHYKLIPLPFPRAIYSKDGQRLPATYANFLIINHTVLLPTYADPADDIAYHTIQACFPHYQIITIDSRPIIENYGSIHCVTMQIPAI